MRHPHVGNTEKGDLIKASPYCFEVVLVIHIGLDWILLIIIIFASSMQNVSQKEYNIKTNGGAFAFSAGSTLFAALFFVISSGGKLNFTSDTLIYSAFFGITYAFAVIGAFLAIKTGPLSFTSLICSFSMIIPTFYGLFFLDEKVSVSFIIGISLLLVSLALINAEKKGDERKITAKWILFVIIGFLGNGMCTVAQKMQQDAFSGSFKSEFMIVALLFVFVSFALISFFTERKQLSESFKGSKWFIMRGLLNGLVNLLVMVLSARMNVSLMFPLISVGGLILTFAISRLVYKENFSSKQYIGFALGVLAVITLNL